MMLPLPPLVYPFVVFSLYGIFRWSTVLFSSSDKGGLHRLERHAPSPFFWTFSRGFLSAFLGLHTHFLLLAIAFMVPPALQGGTGRTSFPLHCAVHINLYMAAIAAFTAFGAAVQLGLLGRQTKTAMDAFMPRKRFAAVSVINLFDVWGRAVLMEEVGGV